MKNAIQKLKLSVHKDLLLSIIILLIIMSFYLFNFIPKTLERKNIKSQEYIFTGKYNLKTISLKQINDLPNVSDKLALKIYNYKNKVKKIEDFKKVKGLGAKKIEMLKVYIDL